MYYCICIYTPSYTVYSLGGFGAWDSRNCRVLKETEEEVECGCDHLTHFAILLVSDSTHRDAFYFAVYRSC